jgi:hypothetical protein
VSSGGDRITIERDELYTADVERALARDRNSRQRILRDPPPVSPLRRILNDSMFYLPAAALLGALAAWLLLEPYTQDFELAAGSVELVNDDPFVAPDDVVAVTVQGRDIYLIPNGTRFEAGVDGQPAYRSIADVAVGDTVEVAGVDNEDGTLFGVALRPATEPQAAATAIEADRGTPWALFLLFPVTALAIALALLVAEGISTRNWARMVERALLGSFLAMLFSLLALIPAAIFILIGSSLLTVDEGALFITVNDIPAASFLTYAACRSAAWAAIGAALGLGMNLVRATRAQLRNAVVGGALGGAVGGLFFDPINRFIDMSLFEGASTSRLVGLLAVGLSIGVFVALVERLAREAWIRVRTGPLAGKSFILYRTPTALGSSPQSDIYLYKDAGIDATHALVHRVGTVYEIEDVQSRTGTTVGGSPIRRRRLASGDQIQIGDTVLEFEERQRRAPA